MRLNKHELNLLNNLELHDYKELSKDELDKCWLKILDTNDILVLEELYANLRHQHGYSAIIDNIEYFIYNYYEKGIFRVCFYNMKTYEDTITKISEHNIKLFSIICDIVNNDLKTSVSLYTNIDIIDCNKNFFYLKILNSLLNLKTKKFKIKKISNVQYFYMKRYRHNGLLKNLKELCCYNKKPFIDRKTLITNLKAR